jgi:hypothetical protein
LPSFLPANINNNNNHGASSSSLLVTGVLMGAQIAFEEPIDFANRIHDTFQEEQTLGVDIIEDNNSFDSMQFNLHLPGPVQEQDRFQFFSALHNISTPFVNVG